MYKTSFGMISKIPRKKHKGTTPNFAPMQHFRRFFGQSPAFTLIELLVVVTIIAILASIAVVNFRQALERSYLASNSANLRTLAIALQTYVVDYNKLPPADREAGPIESHTGFTATGNGPAGGGSWDAVPWLLHTRGYVSDPNIFFNPKYRKEYRGGTTIRGGHPRYHNFRYAYNAAASPSGGAGAGTTGTGGWLLRDLWIAADQGFYAGQAPAYPADYNYPWVDAAPEPFAEQVLTLGGNVLLVRGGTDVILR
jgi:prepilin-type N-terminal cleavage/methylation domain-containing protein